jgi:hypothetical protein
MSDSDETRRPDDLSPEMRRALSRRGFITGEMGKATLDAARKLPGLAGLLGRALQETPKDREERMVNNLWLLLMGRAPKPEESAAGLEVVRNARTVDEKADALVDIAWALCQTRDFEELRRPNPAIVRGFYKIALARMPSEEEITGALELLDQAQQAGERSAALEGLFTGLMRSSECVLRREAAK